MFWIAAFVLSKTLFSVHGEESGTESASWSTWSYCTTCCTQSRWRAADNSSEAESREDRPCNGGYCLPRCSLSRWSPWTSCTLAMGSTTWMRKRRRYHLHPADSSQEFACPEEHHLEIHICSREDLENECGVFGQWTAWSGSCSCGQEIGYQSRIQYCHRPPTAHPLREERPCLRAEFRNACSHTFHCVKSSWSEWNCSADCRAGTREGNIAKGYAVRRRAVGLIISNGEVDNTVANCRCPHREEHALCMKSCRTGSTGSGSGNKGVPNPGLPTTSIKPTATSPEEGPGVPRESTTVFPGVSQTERSPEQASSSSSDLTVIVRTESESSKAKRLTTAMIAVLASAVTGCVVLAALWWRERMSKKQELKSKCLEESKSDGDVIQVHNGRFFINPMYRGTPQDDTASYEQRPRCNTTPERYHNRPAGMDSSSEESGLSLSTVFHGKSQEHSARHQEQQLERTTSFRHSRQPIKDTRNMLQNRRSQSAERVS